MKSKQKKKDEGKTPMLMELLFGDAAELVQREASERLLRWCRAFEEWLAEQKRTCKSAPVRNSVLPWRRLAQQCRKAPWELTETDIDQHAAWMQAQGYSPATIRFALGIFSNFYRWCIERKVDPECEAGFDPAKKVRRPQAVCFRGAKLLSREETERLLRTVQRDPSELGKRDYALILARLRMGVPLRYFQQLKWGQIEHDPEGAWVSWRSGVERQALPAEVWEAIRNALEVSGRLAGISAGDYIFAPLAKPFKAEMGSQPEDWKAERRLSNSQLLDNLKLYGRLAGIEEGKLTLTALRLTSIRLRVDGGASLAEVRAFMDCREKAAATKYRLGKLPKLPPDNPGPREAGENQGLVPDRNAKLFKPGDGATHGFYMRSQPPKQVEAMLKEGVQGIEEQIVGMRMLARELLERQGQAKSSQEVALLGEAYTLAASRIGDMIRVEKELASRGEESQRLKDVLAKLERIAIEIGGEPVSDQARKDALGGEPNQEAAARNIVEEIAAMRYVLRNVFRLASEAQETQELVRLVGIYRGGCVRLLRMLKIEKSNTSQLEAYLNECRDIAVERTVKKLGLVL